MTCLFASVLALWSVHAFGDDIDPVDCVKQIEHSLLQNGLSLHKYRHSYPAEMSSSKLDTIEKMKMGVRKTQIGHASHVVHTRANPFLSETDYRQHSSPLVERNPITSQGIMQIQVGMSRWCSGVNASFDICENVSTSATCVHASCGVEGQSPALGLIHRAGVMAKPVIAGNSPGSYCVVSNVHRFIFVHVLKNAGTSTKKWLQDALCPAGEENCDPETFSLTACSLAMASHPEYFRWTFARHPFDRALSIYAMAKSFNHQDRNLMQNVTFEAFWLDEDRWDKTHLSPSHAVPQTSFMTSRSHCLALDFIGWLPDAEAEMRRVVDLIGAEPLRAHLQDAGFHRPVKGNVFGHNASLDAGATGVELVNASPKLKSVLSELYTDDLELLVSGYQ
jgi:hypothetical protein